MAILSVVAPAQAVPVQVSYSFFYEPPIESQTYPGNSTLGGTLQFYVQPPLSSGQGPCGSAIAIGPISANGQVDAFFFPPDPCFGDPTMELLFSFSGEVTIPPNPITPNPVVPLAYAFPDGVLLPNGPPSEPIPLGSFFSATEFEQSGPIFGFASPGTEIGGWDIAVSQVENVPVPEPPTLPLLAFGAAVLVLLGGRVRG
jgi:hypothetical protein